MIQMINGWFYPAHQPEQQQSSSLLSETIIMIALGALSLIGANAMDREAPGLAGILRLVPVGLTLIWLFNRCFGGSSGQGLHPEPAPMIIPQPVPQPYGNWVNWGNWFNRTHYEAPVHHYQPSPPVYKNPHPPAYAPPAPAYAPPVQPFVPPQAHPQSKTNYSHAQPAAFPHVVPAAPKPSGFPHVSHVSAKAGPFPNVVPAPAQPSGFPQVYKANPQFGGSFPMPPAPAYVPQQQSHPQSRTNYSHAQPAVKAYQAPTYQAQPSAPPFQAMPQGNQPGERIHFAAATHR